MIPEGIEEGDYCLVRPPRRSPGMRIWLKNRQGQACIKRLRAAGDKTYALRGWMEPETDGNRSYDDEWMVRTSSRRASCWRSGAASRTWPSRPS